VLLTYVVGELQGGVGTVALVKQGYRADYFVIASRPTFRRSACMRRLRLFIELVGDTGTSPSGRRRSTPLCRVRSRARLNALKFSGAKSAEHEKINRVHVASCTAPSQGAARMAAAQVADYVKIKGSGRYAPGQTEEGALRTACRARRAGAPPSGSQGDGECRDGDGRVTMPSFEVALTTRSSKRSMPLTSKCAARSSRQAP